jgi:amidophosphoribosyltransferase
MPQQSKREEAVRLKMNAVRPLIEGKKVVLQDDSIVRGTTTRKIVEILQRGGAKEVHVRIGCPPLMWPCFMGIDMATRQELLASNNAVDGIRKILGADSLGYISIDGLVEAIGLPREMLCLACLTGRYPIDVEDEFYREKLVS